MVPAIIAWIAAYTICLINVGLILYRYLHRRDRRLLYFLILILDMLLVTVVVMVLVIAVSDIRIFNVILINCLLSYYLTVPLFVYRTIGVDWPRVRVLVLLGVSLVVFNVLVWNRSFVVVYATYWIPFVLLMIPFPARKRRGPGDSSGSAPDEESAEQGRAIGRTGMTIAAIATILGIAYLFFIRTPLRENVFFANAYFAFFTILYQLPITNLCLRRLPRLFAGGHGPFQTSGELEGNARRNAGRAVLASDNLAALNLTAREREVALKLYEGLTYEEISNAMFVSLSAIKKHAYNIYRKTGVRNNRQLIHKILAPPDSEADA